MLKRKLYFPNQYTDPKRRRRSASISSSTLKVKLTTSTLKLKERKSKDPPSRPTEGIEADGKSFDLDAWSVFSRSCLASFFSAQPAEGCSTSDRGRDIPLDLLKELVVKQRDTVLKLGTHEADLFMEILQRSLDEMHVGDEYRGRFLDLLLQLAIDTSIIPECLVINGVTNRDEFPITTGGFGDVWKAYWSDRTVALKTLRATQDQVKIHRNLCREVLLWRQLRHPHLLEFIGISRDALPSPAIVSPWMQNGNVLQFVATQSVGKKLRLLSQVAKALAYLHDHNPVVIHQDVRCANILVNDAHEAVLSDFGLSRLDSSFFNSFTSCLEHGCLRWQAPELVFPDSQFLSTSDHGSSQSEGGDSILPKPTAQSDIYALGMTVLELITEKKPFSSLALDTAVVIDLYHSRTPTRPIVSEIPGSGALSNEIWSFLTSCWSKSPTERPSANSASTFLLNEAVIREPKSTQHEVLQGFFRSLLQTRKDKAPEIKPADERIETSEHLVSSTPDAERGVPERRSTRTRVRMKQTARKSTTSSIAKEHTPETDQGSQPVVPGKGEDKPLAQSAHAGPSKEDISHELGAKRRLSTSERPYDSSLLDLLKQSTSTIKSKGRAELSRPIDGSNQSFAPDDYHDFEAHLGVNLLETDKGSQPAVPGKAEDEPTNATSKEDPSHKAALNYSRFDALYVDDGDDLNFNELDLGLEFDSQHQQAHTLAHSPKPSALPPDEDEDEDENEERKPTHAKTLGEGLASFKTQSPSFSSDPSPRRLENEPNSADPASVSRVPESLHRDPRASFRCTENKPESSAMQGLEDAESSRARHRENDTDPNPLAFQRLDQVHSLRVPTDFIDVVLGEGLDLFEKTHGVKITTCAGNEESSKELRINPDGTNASSASVKELENLLEYYWRFGVRGDSKRSSSENRIELL